MIEPSLQLNFAKTRQLDRRITFARADTADNQASYYDKNGSLKFARKGEPRFTHDPSTGSSLGLLIEEARTNYCRYNRDLTQTGRWTASIVTTAKTATGVDGVANSASTLTASGTNGTVLQTIAGSTGSATRITSVFVKRRTGTGTIELTQNNGTNWTDITSSINSTTWTRVSLASATVASPVVGFRIGTSGDAIDVDLVQHELGAFITMPILTAADADVARVADSAVMTGANFSSWYRQDEGTFVVECITNDSNSSAYMLDVADGATNSTEDIALSQWAGAIGTWYFAVIDGSVSQCSLTMSVAVGSVGKVAFAYKKDSFAVASKGGTAVTDSAGSVPTPNNLRIGARADSVHALNGTISRLTYYPVRLTNAELQAISKL